MKFHPMRGRARRASGTVRRRTVQFAPWLVESLESRQMLTAGPLGLNLDPNMEFVDAIKETRDWAPASGRTTVTRDANGWPTSDASLVVFD